VAGFAASAERTSWPAGAVLRTPEQRFAGLLGFDYPPRYVEIEGLRMAYVEQGEGDPILMLHGEPTWGYLYRKMIPGLSAAGRAIAPDLIGFGRSDKPVAANAYSYRSHARWVRKFIEQLDLRRITLVCQDWGGLLGLRVLSQTPERFARVVAMNTGISDGRIVGDKGPAFLQWRRFSQRVREMDVARLVRRTLVAPDRLSAQEAAAYNAPFPAVEYQRAVQVFPRLVPIREDDPGADENRRTIARLSELDLPVYLLWGAQDPITAPMARAMQQIFPQAGEAEFLEGAGHFIQEDAGEAAAQRILAWMETA
jgi:haloalkane dehalogenase